MASCGELGLHPGEGLRGDDRRDRHLDPVLFRPWGMAEARPGRAKRGLAAAAGATRVRLVIAWPA
jgi:hypothetical protein